MNHAKTVKPKHHTRPDQTPSVAVAPKDHSRATVELLIESSRGVGGPDPANAVELAREALSLAESLGEHNLILDAAINLINRLNRARKSDERDRLIAGWKGEVFERGTPPQQAYLSNIVAVVHLERSEFGDALAVLRPAMIDPDSIGNQQLEMMIKVNAGAAYMGLGIYDQAITWFYQALEEANSRSDLGICSFIHNNLGIVHRKLGEHDRSEIEFREVIRLAEQTGDKLTLARGYNNLCGVHYHRKQWDKAMELTRMSLALHQAMNDAFGVQACMTNMGVIYQELEEFDLAMIQFEEALAIATALDNKHQIANLLVNVAKIKLTLKGFDEARLLFDKANEIADEIGAQDLIHDILRAKMSLYEQVEDWERAFKMAVAFIEVREETFLGDQRRVIDELRIKYEAEQKEIETLAYRQKYEALEAEIQVRLAIEKDLTDALARIHVLTGLLPVCAECKKVRDDAGDWHQMEYYISNHSDAQFSHGYCPTCAAKALKDLKDDM